MSVEVILNLWMFADPKTKFVYALGARPYIIDGDDDAKFAFLTALAPSDFHLASRHLVPDRYTVALGGKTVKGLAYAPGIPPQDNDIFREVFRGIDADMKKVQAPFDIDNILNVRTIVLEEKDGSQSPQITAGPMPREPESVAVSIWRFVDPGFKQAFAVAGRAYVVRASDSERNKLLQQLAAHDHPLGLKISLDDSDPRTKACLDKYSDNTDVLAAIDSNIPAVKVGMFGEIARKYCVATEKAFLAAASISQKGRPTKSSDGSPTPLAATGETFFEMACQGCRKPLRMKVSSLGKRMKCPSCGQVQVAAQPEQATSFTVQCPGCKKHLKVNEQLAGKRIKHPACGALLVVPDQRQAPPSAEKASGPPDATAAAPPQLPEIPGFKHVDRDYDIVRLIAKRSGSILEIARELPGCAWEMVRWRLREMAKHDLVGITEALGTEESSKWALTDAGRRHFSRIPQTQEAI